MYFQVDLPRYNHDISPVLICKSHAKSATVGRSKKAAGSLMPSNVARRLSEFEVESIDVECESTDEFAAFEHILLTCDLTCGPN